MKSLEIDF